MPGYLDDELIHRRIAVAGHERHHFIENGYITLRETRIALFEGRCVEHQTSEKRDKQDCTFH